MSLRYYAQRNVPRTTAQCDLRRAASSVGQPPPSQRDLGLSRPINEEAHPSGCLQSLSTDS